MERLEHIPTWENATYLGLSNLNLTGPIPQSITKLQKLSFISLAINKLNGNLSTIGWEKLSALRALRLSKNNFGGSLTAFVGNIRSLTFLDIANNALRGEIPYTLSKMKNLKSLTLSNNMFSGSLRPLRTLTNLDELLLDGNNFSDSEMHWLSNLTETEVFT